MGFEYQRFTAADFQMPEGWQLGTVKDVASVNELTLKANTAPDYIEYVDIASVEKGQVHSVKRLLFEQSPSRARRIVRDNDSLISTVRPNLEHYVYIKKSKPNTVASTGFAVVSAKKVNPRYLYYYLTSKQFTEYLTRIAEGHTSAYPAFNPDVIENAELLLPSSKEQEAIACILGTLDDKIETNQKINETLEEIARAIYKSWFVDFDPVRAKAEGRQPEGIDSETAALFPDSFEASELGQIPKGWRAVTLGEIAEVTVGGLWGEETPFENCEKVICLRGCDMEQLRISGYAEAPLRYIKASQLLTRLMTPEDVLLAASGAGPSGRPLWVSDQLIREIYEYPVIYSNFVKRLKMSSVIHAVYIDTILYEKHKDNSIWDYINGTSVPNLDMNGLLQSLVVLLPPDGVLEAFFNHITPVYKKLYSQENRSLSDIRDTLLPKLLSGEIQIKETEKFTEDIE